METVKVIPTQGVSIRCPDTLRTVPPEGMRVSLSKFWRRAVTAGHVMIEEKEPEETPEPEAPAAIAAPVPRASPVARTSPAPVPHAEPTAPTERN